MARAVSSMTRRYSAGVSEYISAGPPAATIAEMGCSTSLLRFTCRPGRSSERSSLNGVIGNAITPESLLRSVFGCMRHRFYFSSDQPSNELSFVLIYYFHPELLLSRRFGEESWTQVDEGF